MKKVLLVDGDIVAFQAASLNQSVWEWEPDRVTVQCDLESAYARCASYISKVKKDLDADEVLVTMSCRDKAYHRKDILPSYKGNRVGSKPPVGLREIKDWMLKEWDSFEYPKLEADDVMGILSTHPKFRANTIKIIVSEDKDMQTIPGYVYNPAKDTAERLITEEMADYFFFMQTLMGDTTDGYKGCPGIGEVSAAKVLDKAIADGVPLWTAVTEQFIKKGLDVDEALVQARMARILRAEDYNIKTHEVKLWEPTN